MKNGTWQLQEAKSKFSELVDTAIHDGAQMVTKHGKPAVVVISAQEYHGAIKQKKSLAAALLSCPGELAPLLAEKTKRKARKVHIG